MNPASLADVTAALVSTHPAVRQYARIRFRAVAARVDGYPTAAARYEAALPLALALIPPHLITA